MMPNIEVDTVTTRIQKKISKLCLTKPIPFIFKVHPELRSVDSSSYEPKILSIGPYHKGKPNLHFIEHKKMFYLQEFLERRSSSLETLVNSMRAHKERAQNCYADLTATSLTTDENNDDFLETMIMDGVFLLELFLKKEDKTSKEDADEILNQDGSYRLLCVTFS